MSQSKKVVVNGGGDNLYRVSISGRTHSIDKVSVGLISNSYVNIGKTESLEDALSIIRSHSGCEIDTIKSW